LVILVSTVLTWASTPKKGKKIIKKDDSDFED